MTERKEISVTFMLTPEQVAQLDRITILYNNISCTKGQNEITPEQLFGQLQYNTIGCLFSVGKP